MIKNERQYRITRAQASRFAEALHASETEQTDSAEPHPLLLKARRDALRSQLDELLEDLREYEALKEGNFQFEQLKSVTELPEMLIKARIARGLSQRDLANRLGLKEQQIQRYEATDYASASLARITDVAVALNVEIGDSVAIHQEVGSFRSLLDKVVDTGLHVDFVRRRLVPYYRAQRESLPPDEEDSTLTYATAETVGKIFDWSIGQLFGSDRLLLTPEMGAVRFKVAANIVPERVTAYTFYAHYLALLVFQTCQHYPTSSIPTDPSNLREAIEAKYGSASLRCIVNYMWDLGVPVLPLDDPSAFHGACFREAGRNVIVLKQRTSSESRWAFDLLHEIWHAGQEPDLPERTVLEMDEGSVGSIISAEEKIANRFAGAFLLEGRGQELAETCLEAANYDLRRLKSVVKRIAWREKVDIAALANYIAFRLAAEQGQNWWATANSLQKNGNPWMVVRNVFFERADLTKLAEPDRQFVAQALTPWREAAYA